MSAEVDIEKVSSAITENMRIGARLEQREIERERKSQECALGGHCEPGIVQ